MAQIHLYPLTMQLQQFKTHRQVQDKLDKELASGRIAGPFLNPPFLNFKCSPLAIREKSQPGKFRLLHNLSYPYDERAVNDNIPHEAATVKYATIRDAIHLIQENSPAAMLAKTDIADAFRIIPLHPSQYHLTGFYWNGYFYDKCLPMGCSSSCRIFEDFSTALKWILAHKLGVTNVVKILDDFLFIDWNHAKCQENLHKFFHLCADVGIPLAQDKTQGPSIRHPHIYGIRPQYNIYASISSHR